MTDQLQDPHHFLPDCLSGWIATLLLDVLGGMFCFGMQCKGCLYLLLCVCLLQMVLVLVDTKKGRLQVC